MVNLMPVLISVQGCHKHLLLPGSLYSLVNDEHLPMIYVMPLVPECDGFSLMISQDGEEAASGAMGREVRCLSVTLVWRERRIPCR